MIWGDFRDEIRDLLEDRSETNPKHSDEALYVYLREAVADYSQFLPIRKEDVPLAQDNGNPRKFALPADFIQETAVACPEGNYLEPRLGRLGARMASSATPLFYRRDRLHLYLNADPGTDGVYLNYDAVHPIPADADDTDFELTIPDADFELIKLYIFASVNTRLRNSQARLDRFKIGQGSRTDNPISNEVEDLFATYHQKIAERAPSEPIILYRPRKYIR